MWKLGSEAVQFPEKEYINVIFSADSTVAPGMNTTPYNLTKWSHFGQSTHTFKPRGFFSTTSPPTNKRNVVSWCILPVVSIHHPAIVLHPSLPPPRDVACVTFFHTLFHVLTMPEPSFSVLLQEPRQL
jgi:hypothetical protein